MPAARKGQAIAARSGATAATGDEDDDFREIEKNPAQPRHQLTLATTGFPGCRARRNIGIS